MTFASVDKLRKTIHSLTRILVKPKAFGQIPGKMQIAPGYK